METAKVITPVHAPDTHEGEAAVAVPEATEPNVRSLPASISPKEWARSGTTGGASQTRDWAAALDLVNEAYEAIRIAEERAAAAEAHSKQLTQFHADQTRAAEARIAASEKRAAAAEVRSMEAEQWLVRFHDTIVDGFQKISGR